MVEILNYRNSLPLDSMLLEYRLESILGAGGFGITYLAYDTHLDKQVAIKEYLPVELAVRTADGCIVPIHTGTEHNFSWGLDRFLQEARLLGRFSHPNIVLVSRYFEANGTAYMVMNYESGVSFSQLLKRVPLQDETMLTGVLMPLLSGLQAVHEAGFLHRDIKPSNIFIRDTGVPMLLDFGSARLAVSGATQTMTSILTPGYAPLEQYSKDGNQGPWTDIYSLAAVMYRGITGDNPPDVVGRLKNDTVMGALIAARDRFDVVFLHAINRGMEVDEKKRPQAVKDWQAMFSGVALPTPAAPTAATDAGHALPAPADDVPTQRLEHTAARGMPGDRKPSMSQLAWFSAGALALFLVIGGTQFIEGRPGRDAAKKDGDDAPAAVRERQRLLAQFQALDADNNGYLSREEVSAHAEIVQAFTTLDADRDGRVSIEEFTRAR